MTRSCTRGRVRLRTMALVATGALVASLASASSAFATGSFPGNETALPPPAIDTSTACPPQQVTNPGFTDIGGDFFRVQIECLADYGVTIGTTSTTYSPTQPVSRGQMAEFFFRLGQMAGIPWDTSTPASNYADADQIPAVFVDAVNALTNAGIVGGFGDHTYRASTSITRGEMSKFIFNFLTFAGAPPPDAHGQDYFSDDDTSVFETFLNGDAAMGFYVGSPGPNGGELAQPDNPVVRDQMAGFLTRIIEFGVENHAFPNKFVPTTMRVSPSSTPVGTSVMATLDGLNITNVSISGPCTSGVNTPNTPAPDNGSQTINVTIPISSGAATGPCDLSVVVTYTDGSTQTLPASVTVTGPAAATGNYTGLTVVSTDVADATFEASDGTNAFTFTYGQPGSTYSYSETPGTGGGPAAKAISLTQFGAFLSGAASPTPGDTIDTNYQGAGAASTFAITTDVPDAPTGVTATYETTPTTGVHLTWTASISPDVISYTVQAAEVDANGQPGSFVDVGSPVTGTESGNVVTQSPDTSFVDTSHLAGSTVMYRVIATADANNSSTESAPSDPTPPLTLSDSSAGTAPAGNGPTNPAITTIANPPAGPAGTTFNVATTGTDSGTCGPVASPCQTIGQAITNAAAGDTVAVGPGTYHELVVLTKPLTVQGFGATVNAAGLSQGSGQTMDAAAILVLQPASGSRVEGFTVHGAYGEGILVVQATNVVIAGNTVSGNNVGTPSSTAYGECQVEGEIPGDCGEGIHLMSTTNSVVSDNVSYANSGGMLVTDELGPNTGNTLDGNLVENNADDCGITMPSHNPNALDANGVPQPTMGGVFGNTVSNNMSLFNGLRGFGAGVLIAAAGPGMASYNNTISGNILNGNGLAGVTIHSHTPNQDVSGNIIHNNVIGQNNLLGDGEFGDFTTTGIAVTSGVVPTTETVSGNTIYNNAQQIFTTSNVTIA